MRKFTRTDSFAAKAKKNAQAPEVQTKPKAIEAYNLEVEKVIEWLKKRFPDSGLDFGNSSTEKDKFVFRIPINEDLTDEDLRMMKKECKEVKQVRNEAEDEDEDEDED